MKILCLAAVAALTAFAGSCHAQGLALTQPKPVIRVSDSLKASLPFQFRPAAILPKNYATKDFGFFCKGELKLEKQTGIPLRLRLGSMEECNRIEGKTR